MSEILDSLVKIHTRSDSAVLFAFPPKMLEIIQHIIEEFDGKVMTLQSVMDAFPESANLIVTEKGNGGMIIVDYTDDCLDVAERLQTYLFTHPEASIELHYWIQVCLTRADKLIALFFNPIYFEKLEDSQRTP